jgi:hypothetical protein
MWLICEKRKCSVTDAIHIVKECSDIIRRRLEVNLKSPTCRKAVSTDMEHKCAVNLLL